MIEVSWRAIRNDLGLFYIKYVSTIVYTLDGETNNFSITIRLYQRFNPNFLSFYFNFECSHGTHPKVSIEIYVFFYSIEVRFE